MLFVLCKSVIIKMNARYNVLATQFITEATRSMLSLLVVNLPITTGIELRIILGIVIAKTVIIIIQTICFSVTQSA